MTELDQPSLVGPLIPVGKAVAVWPGPTVQLGRPERVRAFARRALVKVEEQLVRPVRPRGRLVVSCSDMAASLEPALLFNTDRGGLVRRSGYRVELVDLTDDDALVKLGVIEVGPSMTSHRLPLPAQLELDCSPDRWPSAGLWKLRLTELDQDDVAFQEAPAVAVGGSASW